MGVCISVASKRRVIVKLYAEGKSSCFICLGPPEQFSKESLGADLLISSDELTEVKGMVDQVNLALVNCYASSDFIVLRKLEKILNALLLICFIGMIVFGAMCILQVGVEYAKILMTVSISFILLGSFTPFFLRREKNEKVMTFVDPLLESFNERNRSRKLKAHFQTRKYKSQGNDEVERKPAKLVFLRVLPDV